MNQDHRSDGGMALPEIEGFELAEEIGRGGFSVVYRARQTRLGRDVAVKVLQVESPDHRRFVRECKALGPLSDLPGIVGVLDTAQTRDGRPCIVMPYMAGGSLADRLAEGHKFDTVTVTVWGVELANALASAHDRQIFHRDVKPENILIGRAGDVALTDFGIAAISAMADASQTIASLSPPYAPPERFLTADAIVDHRAVDIYGLGATLYALLSGKPPFGTVNDGGIGGLLRRISDEPVPSIRRPDVGPELNAILAKALAKDPRDRYSDARSLADELQQSMRPSSASRPTADVRTGPHASAFTRPSGDVDDASAAHTVFAGPTRSAPEDPTPMRRPDTEPIEYTMDGGGGRAGRRSSGRWWQQLWWALLTMGLLFVALGAIAFLLWPDGGPGATRIEVARFGNFYDTFTVPPPAVDVYVKSGLDDNGDIDPRVDRPVLMRLAYGQVSRAITKLSDGTTVRDLPWPNVNVAYYVAGTPQLIARSAPEAIGFGQAIASTDLGPQSIVWTLNNESFFQAPDPEFPEFQPDNEDTPVVAAVAVPLSSVRPDKAAITLSDEAQSQQFRSIGWADACDNVDFGLTRGSQLRVVEPPRFPYALFRQRNCVEPILGPGEADVEVGKIYLLSVFGGDGPNAPLQLLLTDLSAN